jgi:predicted ATPase
VATSDCSGTRPTGRRRACAAHGRALVRGRARTAYRRRAGDSGAGRGGRSELLARDGGRREQDGKLWELRAANSLVRLWAEQGERQKAHDLLALLYDWFTEGVDTPDLEEAKVLLDALA